MNAWRCAGLVAAAALVGTPAAACPGPVPCVTPHGEYLLRLPDGWDGRTPLPVLVFMHGYRGSAEDVMADQALARVMTSTGTALVAPQGRDATGRGRGWSFPGKIDPGRDDIAFIEEVVDDLLGKVPVNRAKLVASGFSLGGSMTWFLACQGQGRFAAYAPVAGAFWEPEPVACPAGPQPLRHIHGLADPTVPMTGRVIDPAGRRLKQGNVLRGIATWRGINGCPEAPSRTVVEDGLTCRTWQAGACTSGRELVLCLHEGEHEIDARWAGAAMDWAAGLAATGSRAMTAAGPRP
jgi:polyhydroxybutyrate depolymerase